MEKTKMTANIYFVGYNLTNADLRTQALISGEIKNANYLFRAVKEAGFKVIPISINLFGRPDGTLLSIKKSKAKGVTRWYFEGRELNKLLASRLETGDTLYLTVPSYLPFLKIPKGVRVVVTAHGTYWPELKADLGYEKSHIRRAAHFLNGALQLSIDRASLNKADKLHSVSDFQLKEMVEVYNIPKEKVYSLRNGTDFQCIDGDKIYDYIWVGRLAKKKNISLFIDFLRIVKPNRACICAGNGYFAIDKESLKIVHLASKEMAVDLFFDVTDEVLNNLMSRSKTLVVTSTGYESIPTVIFEGLASGAKVLSPSSWGVNEVEGTGLVTYEEGSIDDLLAADTATIGQSGSVSNIVRWKYRAKEFGEAFLK